MDETPSTEPSEDTRSRTEILLEAIHAENRAQTALLHEFVDAINKVGDMFTSPDGKPVSPMAMITKGLFGGK